MTNDTDINIFETIQKENVIFKDKKPLNHLYLPSNRRKLPQKKC